MVRDYGYVFPYVQKAYELIGSQAKPPGCDWFYFRPWEQVTRGNFTYYAVSLIMHASYPTQLPNGGNLPSVV